MMTDTEEKISPPPDYAPAVKEINCRSLLNKTGLPADYCLNPYTGCAHGCCYCYARFMKKYTHHKEDWGGFVDIKANAPGILDGELKKKKPGRIYLSSVTDAYQPLEADCGLTRACLSLIAGSGFSVSIQTKSALVLRDLDLLVRIKDKHVLPGAVRVGFSIACLDEGVGRVFEPGASPVGDRLRALDILKKSGLSTFCMIAPVLPGLTDVEAIRKTLAGRADFIFEDKLNFRYGNRAPVLKTVKRHFPELMPLYAEPPF